MLEMHLIFNLGKWSRQLSQSIVVRVSTQRSQSLNAQNNFRYKDPTTRIPRTNSFVVDIGTQDRLSGLGTMYRPEDNAMNNNNLVLRRCDKKS